MSYEVLARRWRPKTFEEVAGQRHVTTTLANAIRSQKLPHALLFAGPRGVGKTSIARILARALNCDRGPGPDPCGECTSCTEIMTSTSLDVQEIDAASHTGVENVREIRDSIRYRAGPGKHRIFIIDEVHMLSQAAFNALLKTLEEPPPHSLFIFATTDPQKIPATVLSRVQRFDLKRLPAREVLDRLRQICKSEGIDAPETVLRALVREGDGSARDALTLLDRLVSGLGTEFSEEDAIAVLDLVERRVLWEILAPVLEGDPAGALGAARRALDQGIDPNRLAADLLTELRHLLVARIAEDSEQLFDLAPEEVAELRARAREVDAEALQRLYRVLLARIQDLAFAPRPAHVLEVAVVRLATLPDARSLEELIRGLDQLRAEGTGPVGGGGPGVDGAGGGPAARRERTSRPRRAQGSGKEATPSAQRVPPDAGPLEEAPPEVDAPREPDGPPGALESPPGARPRGSELAKLRNEAKKHPAVRDAIEILGAELRDVKPRREG